ncbi:DUF3846 domain-containing protein [Ruminococcus bicirculans (ex Wegman et al. 2014)]|uniref:DUF3846 domain-containing protein n=1 Tax=Ruminococcus bicirculans (ex Wegman et al. 2014) TaxID=1160721 RepID=UPI001C019A5E|nr:DUF3846 domain-containing protein [Ruminococcus bicirculans (ex Wegman et al. 2014)]MBT9625272.1 DUF3846 domain-containing protein [Ruminococcus bicirculans (ex Wegman et al. 2014)]
MRILVFEPLKEPYVKDIEDDIQAMQEVVGGSIEPIYFEQTNDALCWCNDEFLLNGSKPNRIVGNTLVHGTFYISGNCLNEYGEWDSCSLTDDQIKKYSEMFETPIIVLEQMQATEIEVENTPDEEMADGPADKPEPEIAM